MVEVSDTAYMDAVAKGDMKTAQRLVDAAAKAAGVNREIDPTKIKTFWRVGKPPEGGQSYNTKDQFFEKGVSTYFYPEATSFAGMDRSDWYKVSGEFVGYGSDGEPLVKVESFKKGTPREIDAALKKKPILQLLPGDSFRFPKYSSYADRFTVRSVKRRKDGSLYGYEISSSGIAKDYPIGTKIPNYRKLGPEYLAEDELGVTDITYAPITYDDSGNVIPLSQRFNNQSEDISNPRRSKGDNKVQKNGSLNGASIKITKGKTNPVTRSMIRTKLSRILEPGDRVLDYDRAQGEDLYRLWDMVHTDKPLTKEALVEIEGMLDDDGVLVIQSGEEPSGLQDHCRKATRYQGMLLVQGPMNPEEARINTEKLRRDLE